MTTYIIPRTGEKSLKFKGECIAESRREASPGRRDYYNLYKTESGKFVLEYEHKTDWQGEFDTSNAVVCDSKEDVITALANFDNELFGVDETFSRLAQELLDDCEKEDFSRFTVEEI